MATVGAQLTLNARRHPDRTALIFEGTERSYRQLDDEVNRHAHALIELGVRKGDRVALMSNNSDLFIVAMYAAYKIGAIFVPVNPRSTSRELRYILDDSGAKVLLFGSAVIDAVTGLDKLEPTAVPLTILGLDNAQNAFPHIGELAASMPDTEPGVEVREDDDCIIIYTSGTTGQPKGALFDHHRILWVGHSVTTIGMNSFDRNLHVAPMYHCAELVLFVIAGFSIGTTHVVLPAFEPTAVLDAITKHRITVFLGVPTMYQLMLTVPDLAERDLSSWRLGFFGAAPMPPSAVAKLVATLPDVAFYQLCGQTEGGPTGIYLTPEEVEARPDATGRSAISNAEVRLVDADGNDVATGETGEMIVRGETVMKCYWNNPEATADTIRDGWLHSGDLAVRDADGFITIVDRIKDMIITGGRNVYSVEVENAMASHPDVQDVAVVSRIDDTFGETIVAVATPMPGREISLDGLRAHAAEFIADYKLPRDLVIGEIPRNQSGKILKHVLRAKVRESD
ncbi:long-chain-fatty-acid--CoA ligase [Rhodococcus sp. ABRD24]|uniref:acyl-CoA synthetase n=1 Tax=Rhodococcus sp. ABRD24 TaxID=2507582 RepID=UPI00103BD87D|nr:long-chain fatty acid--CoA ligase [Rhodococcus sp. ABRD24]QBJ96476.1 long-chain-fatty-acid--CoA ligase [Rhodococcus sp. ABRD24]